MSVTRSTIVQVFLVTIAVAGVLFSALQYFSAPRPSLNAVVRGHPHHSLFDWASMDLEYIFELQRNSILRNELSSTQERYFSRIQTVGGVYDILLKNEGNEVARDVVVVVDHALGMKITRGEERQFVAGERFSLGDIKPNDEARIISWTRGNAPLYMLGDPDLSITYDNGVVELDKRYEIEGIVRFIHRNRLHIYFVPILFLVLSIALFVIRYYGARRSNQSSKPQGEDGSG